MDRSKFKRVSKPGVTVILVYKSKLLVLKRIWFPFISHPGIWYVLGGAKEKGESSLEAAYREIGEETKIPRQNLRLLYSSTIEIFDAKRRERWNNNFYLIRSTTPKIMLNIEHRDYRWVALAQFKEYDGIMESLGNLSALLRIIAKKIRET